MSHSQNLIGRAQAYAKSRQISVEEKERLGYGTDGTVWLTSRESALKLFELAKGFHNEVTSCLRLRNLEIPRLVDHDESIMAVEMTIVQPPYLLEFGKVYFNQPPPYWSDSQVREQMHSEGQELFGKRWQDVLRVLAVLQALGIYYVAPKPGNINFGDQ